jgi:hypothetical protein
MLRMILSDKLLEKIDTAKTKLDDARLEEFVRTMFGSLVHDAIVNSSVQDGDNAERKNEVIKNFEEAWKYGHCNYRGEFDLVILTDIAGRIEPMHQEHGQKYAKLRSTKANLSWKNLYYIPPVDEVRVREHLERMTQALNSMDLHPVEEALFLYFHITRIQPFENGNKRTANTMMNLTLLYHGFPPLSILPSEKPIFESYLVNAINGFRNVGSDNDGVDAYLTTNNDISQFYEFMGRKELNELVVAQNTLAGVNWYVIPLDVQQPGAYYAAKKSIDSWFRARGAPHQVQLSLNEKKIEVLGDIPESTLHSILDGIRGVRKYAIKYNGHR